MATDVTVVNQIVNIADCEPHPRNYNRHPDSQIKRIAKSLQKFGQVRSVVMWNGYMLAGHGVREAALSLGWDSLRADVLPDDYPEHLALAYVAADNELGRLADPDEEQLAAILTEARNMDDELLEAMGYDESELTALLETVTPIEPGQDTEPQVDRAEELRQEWGVESGQLWQLGEHRLICGDCTDAAVVERLMNGERINCITTDPPYGVDYDGGTTVREKLSGDDSPALYLPSLLAWKEFCSSSVALYLWYADGDQAVAQAVAQAGWQVRRNLIWNKNQAQFGALSQQYHQKHEPFLYCHLKGQSPYWAGDATEVTVWDIDRESRNELHPTQKPPALFGRAIINSSKLGDIVFDGFSGSGTSIIACENLGRKCRAIEISPAYVAVALQRWADHTGRTPELIS